MAIMLGAPTASAALNDELLHTKQAASLTGEKKYGTTTALQQAILPSDAASACQQQRVAEHG